MRQNLHSRDGIHTLEEIESVELELPGSNHAITQNQEI